MLLSFDTKILLASAMVFSSCGIAQAQAETKEVAIDFAAYVGESEFACGESYEDIGTAESTITPQDFRFYVSDVALIDENGEAVPLELEQDGQWQYQNTVLLDFEDGTATCDNGTPEMNTTVVGTVPEGDYQSLQFTMGVPQDLNHNDAAIAPSPLNLTSMWWNWQGGYKFLRVDMETDEAIATVENTSQNQTIHSQGGTTEMVNEQTTHTNHSGGHQTTHQTSRQASIFQDGRGTHSQSSSSSQTHGEGKHGGSHQQMSNNAYLIHLGSTGCSDSSQSNLFGCANPNRVEVTLLDFNPDEDVVVADLAELLAQSDLSTNQANTPNGCMSSPEDADCTPIMQNLSLSSTANEPEQYFFFVE